jgi:PrtD family type I secretion system ABC transporter
MRLRVAKEPGDPTVAAALAEARLGVAAALGPGMVLNLLMLSVPLYTVPLIDRVLAGGDVRALALLTVLATFALLALGGLEAVRARLLARLASRLGRRLASGLFASGLGGQQRALGTLRELERIRQALGGPAIGTLLDALWLPPFVAVIWLLHPWLGALAAASAGLLLALTLAAERVTRPALELFQAAASAAGRTLDEAARHADAARALGMAPALAARFARANDAALDAQRVEGERAGGLQAASRALRFLALVGIMGLGALLVMEHEITPGALAAAAILLGRALAPLQQLSGAWRAVIDARAAWASLREMLAAVPVLAPAMPLPPPAGRLALQAVTVMAPGGGRPLLGGIGMALEPGEVLGVVGPSAAGKSTLCRVLSGCLAPDEGEVRLDDVDLYGPGGTGFGQHIGYLPQEVGLFAGTVRDNIARMAEADPTRVVEAARLAGVHEMILRLPAGYETVIGEGGLGLSAGQRQRIGLARALYGAPCLVVLDEPTAHLDAAGESALASAIAALKRRGASVVVAANRPSPIGAQVDRILVLDHGRAVDLGPRERVMQRLGAPSRAA